MPISVRGTHSASRPPAPILDIFQRTPMGGSADVPQADCSSITEGEVTIHRREDTFYNPAQRLNRDLSIEVIRACFPDYDEVRILGAMSATGIREIRYLKELPNSRVFLNDMSPEAIEHIRRNLALNGVEYSDAGLNPDFRAAAPVHRGVVSCSDCALLMALNPSFFNVIDIDPFGSCAPFLDYAFRAIKHNGLLCLTCTDKAALCANENKCYRRYGVRIVRNFSQNETPIRALLAFVSRELAKYDSSIVPILSLSVDFYVRVFVRVVKGRGAAVLADNALVAVCPACKNTREIKGSWMEPAPCDVCSGKFKICGPFWNKQIHDGEIVGRILGNMQAESTRMDVVLRLMAQEIAVPFYYEMPELCSYLKINCCNVKKTMYGLANAGYAVSGTHCANNAFKTAAPLAVVHRVLRALSAGAEGEFSFEQIAVVDRAYSGLAARGQIASGLGPLGLPKKGETV